MLRKNEKRERSHNNHLQGMRKSQQKYRVGRGFQKKKRRKLALSGGKII